MTLRSLNNFEIDDIIAKSELKNFNGCFMKDELSQIKPGKDSSTIINLNNSDQKGSHWVCIYAGQAQPEIIYFDSMGELPPMVVIRYLKKLSKKTKKPAVYTSMQLQTIGTESCGWWCIYVLTHLDKGYSMDEILNECNPCNTKINESLLSKFFQSLNY